MKCGNREARGGKEGRKRMWKRIEWEMRKERTNEAKNERVEIKQAKEEKREWRGEGRAKDERREQHGGEIGTKKGECRKPMNGTKRRDGRTRLIDYFFLLVRLCPQTLGRLVVTYSNIRLLDP